MLTVFSSLIGMILGFVPSVIKVYEKNQDNKYNLELTKLRIDAATKNIQLEKDTALIKTNSDTQQAALEHDSDIDTSSWIGIFRASVRPVITYFFFFAFIGSKGLIMVVMLNRNIDTSIILNTVWDDVSLSIFATIISFWFGNRAMEKISNSKVTTK